MTGTSKPQSYAQRAGGRCEPVRKMLAEWILELDGGKAKRKIRHYLRSADYPERPLPVIGAFEANARTVC